MEFINIIVAGVASFAFGAVWYSVLANQWMSVSGVDVVDGKPANQSDPFPYIIGLVVAIFAAGMMAHLFRLAGIDTVLRGFHIGAGIGLFLAAPWLATCYGFAGRPYKLVLIDSGYAMFGSAVMGAVLCAF